MLTGDNRIKADRMWRSPDARREFETETGERDAMTESYQTRFLEWAERKLSQPTS